MTQTRLDQDSSISTQKQDRQTDEKTELIRQLTVPLENIVLEYTDDEDFNSKNYASHEGVPSHLSLFQSRVAIITLLRHAAHGQYREVNDMLTKNPSLLLEKDTVTDYSGRKHQRRTVYQLALGARDCNRKDLTGEVVMDGMIEMIEKHFSRLPNRTEKEIKNIMQEQYDEQFPSDYKKIENEKIVNDLAALDAVIKVIKASKNYGKETSDLEDTISDFMSFISAETQTRADVLRSIVESILTANGKESFETAFHALEVFVKEDKDFIKNGSFDFTLLKAIYRFRNHLEPKGLITSGNHFNYKLLEQAIVKLKENDREIFGSPNFEKYRVCFEKILAYIVRFIPACDSQFITQVDRQKGCKPKLGKKICRPPLEYFMMDRYPDWKHGYNCGVSLRFLAGSYEFNYWGYTAGVYRLADLCHEKAEYQPSPPKCENNDQSGILTENREGYGRYLY